jgi:GNAT superfamily N-acetyltransferase
VLRVAERADDCRQSRTGSREDAPDRSITVRPASEADAIAARDVLRRAIRELCVAHHGHGEQVVAAWLANKTPENVRAWITCPEVRRFGLVQRDGEIQLCSLVPEVQHRGVGKLMLRAFEEQAERWELKRVSLTPRSLRGHSTSATAMFQAVTRSPCTDCGASTRCQRSERSGR